MHKSAVSLTAQTVILARMELEKRKNMRSDMVPVNNALPALESISNGATFELKQIAESVVKRRRRVCRLGPRTENAGSWKCTWCGRANVRHYAGLDHCSECDAEAFTYFTGVENELRVRYSRRATSLARRSCGSRGSQASGSDQVYPATNHSRTSMC